MLNCNAGTFLTIVITINQKIDLICVLAVREPDEQTGTERQGDYRPARKPT